MELLSSLMMDTFMWRAMLAGMGIAIMAGFMGCFVVWRRMAYFGDSLAHSALLGVALGVVAGISTQIGVLLVCMLFAGLLLWLQQQKLLATDTLLGILAHSALSIGLVTLALMEQNIDLHAYLFGDILTVTTQELLWIYGAVCVVLLALWRWWDTLLLLCVHEDLARAEGVGIVRMQVLLMLLMTLVVAVAMHIVGMLLITSLLIIPAASARHITRSGESMAFIAVLLGISAVVMGIAGSFTYDTPAGPSIIVSAAMLFAITGGIAGGVACWRNRRRSV